jgi:exosortase/archaeosortase family protein
MSLTFNKKFKEIFSVFLRLLPILSFIITFFMLYSLDPVSFNYTWKGRTYYLFFVWALSIETILNWDDLKTGEWKLKSIKTAAFPITLLLPVIYVFTTNHVAFNGYANFNVFVINWAINYNMGGYFAGKMPLALEYLVFTVAFDLIILTEYGINRLGKYTLSTFLLGLIGLVYLIDNLYPDGSFTPFQLIVPITAFLATFVLNLMGYRAILEIPKSGDVPLIKVDGLKGDVGIAWQCSGIDSLIIYSVTILAFLKGGYFSRRQKIGCFIFGAVVTYFINILRIVTIITIGINYGIGSEEWTRFHDYYGPLYSITWIIAYPLIIIAVNSLWIRFRKNLRAGAVTI